MNMPVYLDCNATTPVEPEVLEVVRYYLEDEYGNAGSRTHDYGARAKKAVEDARRTVGSVVGADPTEVIFTSGATESNNIALLGLGGYGEAHEQRHIVTTAIEHKAVLEPIERLQFQGFEVTVVPTSSEGVVEAEAVLAAIRPETLLVSVMHVNNETGVRQPIAEIAEQLTDSGPYFHVDSAQSFGKELEALRHPRIDLISASGHKIFAPKGVGVLIARRRGRKRAPLNALMVGGGQERGLRPGTLPVHLIAGMGKAAELAVRDHTARTERCRRLRGAILEALDRLEVAYNGRQDLVVPHAVNCSIPGVDSEAAMLALKGQAAISNGSACTSASYTPSHVLEAMELSEQRIEEAIRLSWCHLTPDVDWEAALTEPLSVLM